MELKNETTQIPASFSMRKPSVKAIFRGLSLFIEMGHQKAKTEKWVVKTIKCIYSEPGILMLMRILSFYPSIPALSALESYIVM